MVKKRGARKTPEIYLKINALDFGLAAGIICGICVFLVTLLGILFGLFPETLSFISDIYGWIGYDVTGFGLVLGLVYGFIDGFIFFGLLAWLYNLINK